MAGGQGFELQGDGVAVHRKIAQIDVQIADAVAGAIFGVCETRLHHRQLANIYVPRCSHGVGSHNRIVFFEAVGQETEVENAVGADNVGPGAAHVGPLHHNAAAAHIDRAHKTRQLRHVEQRIAVGAAHQNVLHCQALADVEPRLAHAHIGVQSAAQCRCYLVGNQRLHKRRPQQRPRNQRYPDHNQDKNGQYLYGFFNNFAP